MSFSFRNLFSPDEAAEGSSDRTSEPADQSASPDMQEYLVSELLPFIPPAIVAQNGIPMNQKVRIALATDGSTDVRLSTVYQACPALFAAEITPLNDSMVSLPPKTAAQATAIVSPEPDANTAANPFGSDPAPAAEENSFGFAKAAPEEVSAPAAAAANPFSTEPSEIAEPTAEENSIVFIPPGQETAVQEITPDVPAVNPFGQAAVEDEVKTEVSTNSFETFDTETPKKEFSDMFSEQKEEDKVEVNDPSDLYVGPPAVEPEPTPNMDMSDNGSFTFVPPGMQDTPPAAEIAEPIDDTAGTPTAEFVAPPVMWEQETEVSESNGVEFVPPADESAAIEVPMQEFTPAEVPVEVSPNQLDSAPSFSFQPAPENVVADEPKALFVEPEPVPLAAPVQEAPVEEAPAQEALIEEEPVQEALEEEAPVQEALAEEEPVQEAPIEEEPVVQEAPVEEELVQEALVEEEPMQEATVEEELVQEAPIEEEPAVQEALVEEAPVQETPIEEEPVQEVPIEAEPVQEIEPVVAIPEPAPTLPMAAVAVPATVAGFAATAASVQNVEVEHVEPAPVEEFPEQPVAAQPVAQTTFGPASQTMRDIELRAIFDTDENFSLRKVSQKVAALDDVLACAVVTQDRVIEAYADEKYSISDKIQVMAEHVRGLAAMSGVEDTSGFTIQMDQGVMSFFFGEGHFLGVKHQSNNFQPGVREKLIVVARSLHSLEN